MQTPEQILGVSLDDSPEAIRRRYLELVRQYPPDQEPEKFQAIRAAYEALQDPRPQIEAFLKLVPTAEARQRAAENKGGSSGELSAAEARHRLAEATLPTTLLLSLGQR